MKILAISGILPIPPVIKNNDFVFQIYSTLIKLIPDTTLVIIKPIRDQKWMFKRLKEEKGPNDSPNGISREIRNFRVEIFPYYSTWRFRNLHAFISSSIFYMNKRRIKHLMANNKFDVIHAQYLFPDGLLAYHISKKYKIPYVITSHNESVFFNYIISKNTVKKILTNASKVLPINYTNYSYYKSIGISELQLIPLGFDKNFIRVQRKHQFNEISVLSVCELIKLKNIDKVILALSHLIPKYPIRYTIIGDGPEKEKLKELVNTLNLNNHISFISHVPHEQIADEMYKHDLFIMPSYFETFGRVYFEAMAMGIPIICAKHSGIYGLFRENEEGISVDHQNIEEIIGALEYFISNPSEIERIGMNGKKIVEKFTWENIALELQSIYSSIV
jgi:teichuronic acid biosynthesis glycosyltransferase TuaC